MDDEIDDFIIIQILKKNKGVYIIFFFCRTSLLSGKMYTLEILASHDDWCYENFRIKKTCSFKPFWQFEEYEPIKRW